MQPVNPYEAPQAPLSEKPISPTATAPGEAWHEPLRTNLVRVARYHRGMTCFALLFFMSVAGIVLIKRNGGDLSSIAIIPLIGFGIATIVFTCFLSLEIQAKERPLVVAFGMLIPPAALMLLLQYSLQATQYLKSHGMKVGLLGTKRKDIVMQIDQMQARHEQAIPTALSQN